MLTWLFNRIFPPIEFNWDATDLDEFEEAHEVFEPDELWAAQRFPAAALGQGPSLAGMGIGIPPVPMRPAGTESVVGAGGLTPDEVELICEYRSFLRQHGG